MNPRRLTIASTLTISLLSLFGIWLLAYSTPYGLGLNDDSIAYIAGARSILIGQGYRESWLVSNGPVTHFPPGFPFVLAAIGFVTNLDPLHGARALNGLLFGLNIALTGWVGWRMTRSRIAGILVAVLVLANNSLLYIHSRAMSEPLYIFLMLLSFLLLDMYFERPRNLLLVALGFILGWAYLARYAALSLLATMLAAMLILHIAWRKRWSSLTLLALSAFPWILGWSIRNRVVGGSYTNRVLGWHPITPENWHLGVRTFAEFLMPVAAWRNFLESIPAFFESLLLIIGLALLAWVLYKGLPIFFRPAQIAVPNILSFITGLYIIIYLTALVVTMTVFDPATQFQVRILSPVYISLLLLFVALGAWFWREQSVTWKQIMILCAFFVLGVFSYGQVLSVQEMRLGGGVFANEKWAKSEAINVLKQLPPDVLVLTNEPGLVYLYTGRPAGVLPRAEPSISQIKQPVLDGKVVIALFRVNKADQDTLAYYYDLGRNLYLTDLSSAWIFSAFPK